MNKLKGLIEKRNDYQSQMQELLDSAKAENRAMTDDEISKFDALEKKISSIDKTIEREEKREKMQKKEKKEQSTEERDVKAFAGYIRSVVSGVEHRADTMLEKGENGAVIPSTIVKKIIEKVEEISPVYKFATKYNAKGTVSVPKEDSSSDAITVSYATEFTDLTSHSNKFATIELTGYLYGALTKISKSLLKNSDFKLTAWVVAKMAKKIAQFIEGECLNGTEGKAKGIAGSYDKENMKLVLAKNTAVTVDELIDLQALVPDVYQKDAFFIMNTKTRTAIRKLKDNEGRYILNADATSPFGYTILGKPVYTSDNVSKLGGNGENVIFYGDYSGLAVKESESTEIQILNELFAAQHAIGVVAWGEIDAKVEDTQKIAVAVTPDVAG